MRRTAVGALLAAIFVYRTDSHQRAVTLFETKFDWEQVEEKKWVVEVEHAGVEHTVYVSPELPPLKEAAAPVTLRLVFVDAESNVLFERELEFQTETQNSKNSRRKVWESQWFNFVPPEAGIYQLSIEAVGGYPPLLFMRIEDPMKKDGKRAPGY